MEPARTQFLSSHYSRFYLFYRSGYLPGITWQALGERKGRWELYTAYRSRRDGSDSIVRRPSVAGSRIDSSLRAMSVADLPPEESLPECIGPKPEGMPAPWLKDGSDLAYYTLTFRTGDRVITRTYIEPDRAVVICPGSEPRQRFFRAWNLLRNAYPDR